IGLLNADDCYEHGTLEAVATALRCRSHAFAYGSVMRVDQLGQPVSITRPLPPSEFIRRCTKEGAFPHPSLFVCREVYQGVGVFDTAFRVAADRDFIARLILSGRSGVEIKRVLTRMRTGGASDRVPYLRDYIRIARKHRRSVVVAVWAF